MRGAGTAVGPPRCGVLSTPNFRLHEILFAAMTRPLLRVGLHFQTAGYAVGPIKNVSRRTDSLWPSELVVRRYNNPMNRYMSRAYATDRIGPGRMCDGAEDNGDPDKDSQPT